MVTSLNLCSTNATGLDTSRPTNDSWEKAKVRELVLVEWVDIISDDWMGRWLKIATYPPSILSAGLSTRMIR